MAQGDLKVTRIYFGRPKGAQIKVGGEWKEFPEWRECFWEQHQVFQDAVNYYTLCIAAMLGSVDRAHSATERAVAEWRARVEETWAFVERRGSRFEGPGPRLSKLFGVHDCMTFADACKYVLRNSLASPLKLKTAGLALLADCEKRKDLKQVAGERIAPLCSRKFEGSPTHIREAQARLVGKTLMLLEETRDGELADFAATLDVGQFRQSPPTDQEWLGGAAARAELRKKFNDCLDEQPPLRSLREDFERRLTELGDLVRVPTAGTRPPAVYKFGFIFHFLPCPLTRDAFLKSGRRLLKAAKTKDIGAVQHDPYVAVREDNRPAFEYFTNILLSAPVKERCAWFEFDKAAFKAALSAPHRYLQDTLKRDEAAAKLKADLQCYYEKGGRSSATVGEEEPIDLPGFEEDHRIVLLQQLLLEIAPFSEEDDARDERASLGYTIQSRTLRGFPEIREKWRRRLGKGPASDSDLQLDIKSAQQADSRAVGSAVLFNKLTEEKYRPIWAANGSKSFHAEDPLRAWASFLALQREIADNERPIRFTPAHSIHSPRFLNLDTSVKHDENGDPRLETLCIWRPSGESCQAQLCTVRLDYTSPRLIRDAIIGTDDHKWLPPLLRPRSDAIAIKSEFAKCSVSFYSRSTSNMLLGFPVSLEGSAPAERTRLQYRSTKTGAELFGLAWEFDKAAKNAEAKGTVPWFAQKNELSLLSVDLGLRMAAAAARLTVTPQPSGGKNFTGIHIGDFSTQSWFATLKRTYTFRLPGENCKIWRSPTRKERESGQVDAGWREEIYGREGRSATVRETDEAVEILRRSRAFLSATEIEQLRELSFPAQNDELLRHTRAGISRVNKLHRWAWFLSLDEKRGSALQEIGEQNLNSEWNALVRAGQWAPLRLAIIATIAPTADMLKSELLLICRRCVPLRNAEWIFTPRTDGIRGYLLQARAKGGLPTINPQGQRGLSIRRIEQLELLRRCFMSLNRTLIREPGEPFKVSRDAMPEVCAQLLEKIDKIKEQRINQTAHIILENALGLKRKGGHDKAAAAQRARGDIHGRYEPADAPVDFIAIENLSRYRASQDRPRFENSKLMQWCHRAIVSKLKQLCEPFRIPIVEVHAAYSSQFCSRTGVIGFRAEEVSDKFLRNWYWRDALEKASTPLAEKFKEIEQTLQTLNKGRSDGKKRTFLLPRPGGPVFVPLFRANVDGVLAPIQQADVNAAINIGLRAIAHPSCLHIHHRIRTEGISENVGSLREDRLKKALNEKKIEVLLGPSSSGEGSSVNDRMPNLFVDTAHGVPWGTGDLKLAGKPIRVALSKAIFSTRKELELNRCDEINEERKAKWAGKSLVTPP